MIGYILIAVGLVCFLFGPIVSYHVFKNDGIRLQKSGKLHGSLFALLTPILMLGYIVLCLFILGHASDIFNFELQENQYPLILIPSSLGLTYLTLLISHKRLLKLAIKRFPPPDITNFGKKEVDRNYE